LSGVYREHDIFVFPSTWQEPFGLTHLEAMACGTPVISTADGGHGEFLKDGENALIFEKENPGQLAAQISRLISDNDLAGHLAATARAMVEQEFTLQRYVTDIEAFLQEAATGENR
jgi:glycosyltransferase involved in cell wall biosynthesis